MASLADGPSFETEVRQTAAALWDVQVEKAAAREIGGQEIDCVCDTEELTHLVMCTVSPALGKAKDDIQKLQRARHDLSTHGATAKGWLVTSQTPTRDQREAARTANITIISLRDFRSKLLDANFYFALRNKYAFGSAVNPDNDSVMLPENEYMEQPIAEFRNHTNHTPDSLADLLSQGRNVVLLGHFGAGKSITVSQVFRRLARRYQQQESDFIPIALNLRQHWGQIRVTEAIRRHAEDIGLPKPDQLVRAWNAGKIIALLDGFDELTYQGATLDLQAMRENRRSAMMLVRAFATGARGQVGLMVTGRQQYFDTAKEMHGALGVDNSVEVELGDFTEEQALLYLKRKKQAHSLPDWLPRRPLLISYLTSKGLLDEILSVDGAEGPAAAWQEFLPKIAQREADLSSAIDQASILHLLEHLATVSRGSSNDSGLILPQHLFDAFKVVTYSDPSEQVRVLLGRLPGLTVRGNEFGARSFVDIDMLDVLRGRWVSRFIADPNNMKFPATQCLQPLGELGYQAAALTSSTRKTSVALHRVAAAKAIAIQQPTLALDCLLSGSRRGAGPIDAGGLQIEQGEVSVLDLSDFPIQQCILSLCAIRLLRLGEGDPQGVILRECLIERVDGVINLRSLPSWIQSPEIGAYDEAQTTAALMALPVPMPVRVLLSVLHKLFEQRGRGRKESALLRGIPQEARAFVPKVLAVLQKHGLAKRMVFGSREVVWHPERAQTARAGGILEAPRGNDPALVEVRELG